MFWSKSYSVLENCRVYINNLNSDVKDIYTYILKYWPFSEVKVILSWKVVKFALIILIVMSKDIYIYLCIFIYRGLSDIGSDVLKLSFLQC